MEQLFSLIRKLSLGGDDSAAVVADNAAVDGVFFSPSSNVDVEDNDKSNLVVDDDGDRGKLEQKPDTEEGRGAMNSKCPTTHLHNLLSNHCSCYMRYTWTKKMGKAEILKTK